jgi:methionyl-tRNA formyltransferase
MERRSRLVFLGTGEIARPVFRWLIDAGHPPVGLVTQPDRPAGRRREPKPSVLKAVALDHGIEVLQPGRVRDPAALEAIRRLEPELIVVMAYGQMLPQALIDMPPLGCVNLHASLLPQYRGAACIQAALDAGDAVTGVTLMHVVRELDAGDVIGARETPIRSDDTAGTLHDRLAETAVEVLAAELSALLAGRASRTPQADLGEATRVPKLGRDDGRLDWHRPAAGIERRLRAYDPWPGCWTTFRDANGDAARLKIFPARGVEPAAAGAPGEIGVDGDGLVVACGEGALRLGDVQPDGGRRMDALDWWRRFRGDGPQSFD